MFVRPALESGASEDQAPSFLSRDIRSTFTVEQNPTSMLQEKALLAKAHFAIRRPIAALACQMHEPARRHRVPVGMLD